MENQSMTALISAFARAYHAQNSQVKVFDDTVVTQLMEECLQVFEIDHPLTSQVKRAHVANSGLEVPENVHYIAVDLAQPSWVDVLRDQATFDTSKLTFSSLLGLSYYMAKEAFEALVMAIGSIVPKGSSLVFDYPERGGMGNQDEKVSMQEELAKGAGEAMEAPYTYREMEVLLERAGFLIYEHLTTDVIQDRFFKAHNDAQPAQEIKAFLNVNYCLAVKSVTQ